MNQRKVELILGSYKLYIPAITLCSYMYELVAVGTQKVLMLYRNVIGVVLM